MRKWLLGLALVAGSVGAEMARSNGMELWYETFGEGEPLVLVHGSCCQGMLWPEEFCEKLADEGFLVVRYDHRDIGWSTCLDFKEKPYTHADMAEDLVGLMDWLEIERAHLVGLSMGGPIAELVAGNHGDRVESLTLIATSCDFRVLDRALVGLPREEGSLSGPKEHYLEAIAAFQAMPAVGFEEDVERRVAIWQLVSGDRYPLDVEEQRELQGEFLRRQRYPQGMINHLRANALSEELVATAPRGVKVPTLILHGSEDPIFGRDHAEALAGAIEGSRLVWVEGMGHVPNPAFYDLWVREIVALAQ